MSDDSTRPIVIKRKKVVAGGAHGGAWKIAYADFVTAMMAFFLLMWLLGSTAKGDLQGIASFSRIRSRSRRQVAVVQAMRPAFCRAAARI